MDTINNTGIVRDYRETGKLPTIDQLLDWRNRLSVLRKSDGIFPQEWYDTQIKATDYLLDKHALK